MPNYSSEFETNNKLATNQLLKSLTKIKNNSLLCVTTLSVHYSEQLFIICEL